MLSCCLFVRVSLSSTACRRQSHQRSHQTSPSTAQVRKRHFLRHLYIKINILPRQARDKHRETTQKKVPFSLSWIPRRYHTNLHPRWLVSDSSRALQEEVLPRDRLQTGRVEGRDGSGGASSARSDGASDARRYRSGGSALPACKLHWRHARHVPRRH